MNTYIKKYTKKELVEDTGRISWTSPSNIALIKYWGKHGKQLPSNPSISLTLSESKTTMDFSWSIKNAPKDEVVLDFYFESKKNIAFEDKIRKFLENNFELFPFLKYIGLEIESENSFPHSTGIASSASSMSALALGLCSIEDQAFDLKQTEEEIFEKATFVARLASGSASRSVYPGVVSWGDSGEEGCHSTDQVAKKVDGIAEIFSTYHDSIVIVDGAQKSVSSTAGHALMNNHPFSKTRFIHAREQFHKLLIAMRESDLESFCEIVEQEALELHGLMMNSSPSYILMRPNTLAVIEKVRAFRKSTGLALCFTLDAGPNVHLLYPDNISAEVKNFINTEITDLAQNGLIIDDKVGGGPERFL